MLGTLEKSSVVTSIPGNSEPLNLSLSKCGLKGPCKISQQETKQNRKPQPIKPAPEFTALGTVANQLPDAQESLKNQVLPYRCWKLRGKGTFSFTNAVSREEIFSNPYSTAKRKQWEALTDSFFVKSKLYPIEHLFPKSKIAILLQEARHSLSNTFT